MCPWKALNSPNKNIDVRISFASCCPIYINLVGKYKSHFDSFCFNFSQVNIFDIKTNHLFIVPYTTRCKIKTRIKSRIKTFQLNSVQHKLKKLKFTLRILIFFLYKKKPNLNDMQHEFLKDDIRCGSGHTYRLIRTSRSNYS